MIKQFEQLIGNTPIVRLANLETPGTGQIYVKLEQFNLGGSIKDRVALSMIQGAEQGGRLKPGMRLIEPTSGNTGIAIALLGQLKGYPVTIVMPESMSKERRQLIAAYGADLVLTPASEGMNGSIRRAEAMLEVSGTVMLQQFNNPNNPLAHHRQTAREIFSDLPDLDYFIAGIGTGGTITGIGRAIREEGIGTRIIGIEPAESAVISGGSPGSHGIQGIGAGFIPNTLDLDVLDEVITLSTDRVKTEGPGIYRTTGLFVGISAMANILAARNLAQRLGAHQKVLTVAPDSGAKYLSSGLYGGETS